MRIQTLSSFLIFLFACGCSVSPPSVEAPSCGPPIDSKTVVVVDAEKVAADQDFDAITEYAIEQAGPFELISTSSIRSSTFPRVANQPSWIHAQEAAASQGCDLLILVESRLQRLAGDSRQNLYLYFLMGSRSPE